MKKLFSIVLLFLLLTNVKAQESSRFFPKKDLMTTGIYYYPEHWNPSEWERDIKNISEMGFQFIHIAEFAWIEMEPQQGKYDFKWLDTVVDLATKYKLKVIIGTPTAITPVWMGTKYPEIYVMDANYQRAEHGTRANSSLSNPVFRDFSVKIIKELGKRYGKNPAVCGWQLDNEPEAKADFSPSAQAAFQSWLQKKYGSIANFNTAWGTAFWSQTYSSFDQVLIPNAQLVGWWGTNPHALLDFKRFTSDVQTEFLNLQAEILRPLILENQYITTNYTAWNPAVDTRRADKMDFSSFTAYPNGGSVNIGDKGFRLGDSKVISFANDFYRPFKGITGVMELQPGPWGETIYPLIDAKISNFDHLPSNEEGKIAGLDKTYSWNNWADLIEANQKKNILATYADQFYAGKAAVVTNKLGKGTVTYIGVDTDKGELERDVLKKVYEQAGATTENYPEGVYVQWRDGFWVAVNYSSTDYQLEIPAKAEILVGNTTLKPAGVTVWKE